MANIFYTFETVQLILESLKELSNGVKLSDMHRSTVKWIIGIKFQSYRGIYQDKNPS